MTKRKTKRNNTLMIGILTGVIVAIIVVFAVEPTRDFVFNLFNKPENPEVISLPNGNAIENSDALLTVHVVATPDFNPPYYVGVSKRIINPNSYTCDMTIKFTTSEGFLFSPTQNVHMIQFYEIPSNFELDDNFEYSNTMIVNIKDFPAGFPYDITFSVYTMNPDVYRDTEDVTYEVIAVEEAQDN
jgi:hypothetical protein